LREWRASLNVVQGELALGMVVMKAVYVVAVIGKQEGIVYVLSLFPRLPEINCMAEPGEQAHDARAVSGQIIGIVQDDDQSIAPVSEQKIVQ
jgi:hypothetical protein